MDDLIKEEAPVADEAGAIDSSGHESPAPEQRTGPTGPRTIAGKAISSENRIDHGCRSEKTVLRTEDPAEFESCVNGWFEYYEPKSSVAIVLVQETARAHWLYKRASKCLEDVAWRLPGDAWCWTEENHRLFSNFSRYKTAAERTFNRFFKEAERHFDKLLRMEEMHEHARETMARIDMKWLTEKEKSAPSDMLVRQIIDVEVIDGKCTSSYYPPTDSLIKKMAERPSSPAIMTRCIRFPHGVPPEYAWAYPNHIQEFTNTAGVQTMSYDFWRDVVVEREKATGHAGPSGVVTSN